MDNITFFIFKPLSSSVRAPHWAPSPIRDNQVPIVVADVLHTGANAILRNTSKQNPSAFAAFLCFRGFSHSKESACGKMITGRSLQVPLGS
jgi:hypothetical protein